MPFKVEITVYNSAGEAVDHLFDGASQNLPGGFTLNSNLVAPGGAGVTIQLGGLLQGGKNSLTWLGLNDGGQYVTGGIYSIQIKQVDPFGTINTWSQQVSVLPPDQQQSIAIYNSAGELVTRLDDSSVLSTPTAQVTGIGFANGQSTFVLPNASSGAGGVILALKEANGTVVSLPWNGRNSQGQEVASGSYTVQLVNQGMASSVILDSKVFTVLDAPGSGTPKVFTGPNPLGPADKVLTFAYTLPSGEAASVKLYDAAGELVAGGVSAVSSGAPGKLSLKVGNWAAGIYLAVFEVWDSGSLKSRHLIKVAMSR
jgi:flagellar hook assembly protein FlgD